MKSSCDGSVATTVLGRYEDSSTVLASDFGFDLPNGCTIDGVKVEIRTKAEPDDPNDTDGEIVTSFLALTKDAGTTNSTNKGDGNGDFPWGGSLDFHYSAGGENDDWNFGLTWQQVENEDFGVLFACENFGRDDFVASVDCFKVTVWVS